MQSIAPRLAETYEATPETVGQARASLARFALAAGATAERADAVRLAVSEAMTNAVVHAYGDERGVIHVTAGAEGGAMWILITDDGGGVQPQSGRPGLGLGLGLISELSDTMAIVSRAGGGTEVQMRFGLQPDGAAPADPETPRPSGRARDAPSPRPGCGPWLSIVRLLDLGPALS